MTEPLNDFFSFLNITEKHGSHNQADHAGAKTRSAPDVDRMTSPSSSATQAAFAGRGKIGYENQQGKDARKANKRRLEAMDPDNATVDKVRARIKKTGDYSTRSYEAPKIQAQIDDVKKRYATEDGVKARLPKSTFSSRDGDSVDQPHYDWQNDKVYTSITRQGTFRLDKARFSVKRDAKGNAVEMEFDGIINGKGAVITSPYEGKPYKYEPKD